MILRRWGDGEVRLSPVRSASARHSSISGYCTLSRGHDVITDGQWLVQVDNVIERD